MGIIKLLNPNSKNKPQVVLEYLIALILITLPLENIYVSIATIGFVVATIFIKKTSINFKTAFLITVLFFIIGLIISGILYQGFKKH